jgi:hypothetical protein
MAWTSRNNLIKAAVSLVVDSYDLKPPGRDILSMSKPREADRRFISTRVTQLLDREFTFMRGDFGTASPRAYYYSAELIFCHSDVMENPVARFLLLIMLSSTLSIKLSILRPIRMTGRFLTRCLYLLFALQPQR